MQWISRDSRGREGLRCEEVFDEIDRPQVVASLKAVVVRSRSYIRSGSL